MGDTLHQMLTEMEQMGYQIILKCVNSQRQWEMMYVKPLDYNNTKRSSGTDIFHVVSEAYHEIKRLP